MYTFKKSERLCSKKLIAQLFVKGNRSISRFPFRFSWFSAKLEDSVPVQVLFVVSKRNFPHATERNKIKRHLRELYRLAKPELYKSLENKPQVALSIMYNTPSKITFSELSKIFATCIKLLCNDLEKNNTSTVYFPDKDI